MFEIEHREKRRVQPVILVILDGFGLRKSQKNNAIALAKTPTISRFFKDYFIARLDPSGTAVGLPPHQMGTSEVGHLNIGGGRVVNQDLVRINNAIKDWSFFHNRVLLEAMERAKSPGAALHLLGLCSDGGVHSHLNHLYALLDMAKLRKVRRVFIHAITDGRDTESRVARRFLSAIKRRCKKIGLGEIATVSGRYYAMDRDNRWGREKLAYNALTLLKGPRFSNTSTAVLAAYKRGEGDEFIKPSIIKVKSDRTPSIIDGDSVIFFNFRQDRARQLTHGFTDLHFEHFRRKRLSISFSTLTSYDSTLKVPVAFPPEIVKNPLAEWLSRKRLRQFHTAETEKYAHVTYFFNGGRERPFRGEDRLLIPSPKVETYDLQPEMSARPLTKGILKAMQSGLYQFIVVNFANADMVGHTGSLKATIKAVETLDESLSHLETEAKIRGYSLLVTADHGNAEQMSGLYKTTHTLNKVPFFVMDKNFVSAGITDGRLADVATTVLYIMNLEKPEEMTGRSLVKRVK